MTCEHCGNTIHTRNNCPENGSENVNFINNTGFSNGPRPQLGWNSPPNLPFAGQGLKVYTRPPHPRTAGKEQGKQAAPEEEDEVDREPPLVKEALKAAPHEFYDTTVLPFPQRQKKASVDDQFSKFVEVIKRLYVNTPLLDAMQVPTYAKDLKDILNNRKQLPSTKVVHLTEECSVLYSTSRLKRRRILGTPPYHAQSEPRTLIKLSLVDQLICYPVGIAEDVPVKIQNFIIPMDFVVLDMEVDTKTPLILGRPFLSTAQANIDIGVGEVHLNINGRRETFAFKPKVEQCRQAPQETPREKIELSPSKPKMNSLLVVMEKLLYDGEARKLKADRRAKSLRRASLAQPSTKDLGGKAPETKVTTKATNTSQEWWKKEEMPKAKPEKKTKTQKQKTMAIMKVWRAKVAAQTAAKSPSNADSEPKV
ncbi:hypothetical protein U9M48_031662 [Paspalum notatum var. saurae]|uniref:Uncharacterized protein n=1 Tax=Paspalum notatum var. saurae TaxID=547442 RepID=A0AAQ3X4Y6_PASNO